MIARRHILAAALRDAADQYDVVARDMAGVEREGIRRIAEGFTRQAAEARKLAAEIEQAETITLED